MKQQLSNKCDMIGFDDRCNHIKNGFFCILALNVSSYVIFLLFSVLELIFPLSSLNYKFLSPRKNFFLSNFVLKKGDSESG